MPHSLFLLLADFVELILNPCHFTAQGDNMIHFHQALQRRNVFRISACCGQRFIVEGLAT